MQYDQIDELKRIFFRMNNIDYLPNHKVSDYIQFRGVKSLLFSEAAVAWLYLVGIDLIDQLTSCTVAKFLNRILGLQFDRQNMLFQVYNMYLYIDIELTVKS